MYSDYVEIKWKQLQIGYIVKQGKFKKLCWGLQECVFEIYIGNANINAYIKHIYLLLRTREDMLKKTHEFAF